MAAVSGVRGQAGARGAERERLARAAAPAAAHAGRERGAVARERERERRRDGSRGCRAAHEPAARRASGAREHARRVPAGDRARTALQRRHQPGRLLSRPARRARLGALQSPPLRSRLLGPRCALTSLPTLFLSALILIILGILYSYIPGSNTVVQGCPLLWLRSQIWLLGKIYLAPLHFTLCNAFWLRRVKRVQRKYIRTIYCTYVVEIA